MAQQLFNTVFGDFSLYQPDAHTQAHSQADNYLLEQLHARNLQEQSLAIINDNYAALATVLQDFAPACYNDSAIYHYCLRRNLPEHTLAQHTIDQLSQAKEKVFLLRLPKSLHFLNYILAELSCLPDITVLVSGMQKHWPSSFYQAAEHYFDKVDVLDGVKKAKCMVLSQGKAIQDVEATIQLDLEEFDLKLCNYPNVFSREQLDIGSRFLLENFPDLSAASSVLDLACGNGVLGIYAQKKVPELYAHYIDESAFAVQSCLASLALNGIDASRYQVLQNHVLYGLNLKDIDVVLCNPPFHQHQQVSIRIGSEMIKQSKRCLAKDGVMYLVANQQLPYFNLLQKQFRQVSALANNSKFVIYQASEPF